MYKSGQLFFYYSATGGLLLLGIFVWWMCVYQNIEQRIARQKKTINELSLRKKMLCNLMCKDQNLHRLHNICNECINRYNTLVERKRFHFLWDMCHCTTFCDAVIVACKQSISYHDRYQRMEATVESEGTLQGLFALLQNIRVSGGYIRLSDMQIKRTQQTSDHYRCTIKLTGFARREPLQLS